MSLSGASESEHIFLDMLNDIAKRNEITNYKLEFANTSSGAKGYMTTIKPAEIISAEKIINVIVKFCGSHEKTRKKFPITSIFNLEIYMYTTVFPFFERFEIHYGLTPTQYVPKYYSSYSKDHFNAIILSDLKKVGFALYDSKSFMDDLHVKLGIKVYAHLHATSLCYKDQKPKEFKTLVESMEDTFLPVFKNTGFIEVFVKRMQSAVACLHHELCSKIKDVSDNMDIQIRKYFLQLPSKTDKYSAIVHGDSWKNNMLFKYEDSSTSIPCDIRLIDFQLARFASPMLDLGYFFYACSSKEIVDDMPAYLTYYYDCLSKRLRELGSDPEVVYPFSVMLKHWKQFAFYGLVMRVSTLVVHLSDDQEHLGITDVLDADGKIEDMFDFHISDVEQYRDICTHALRHFIDNDLLPFDKQVKAI